MEQLRLTFTLHARDVLRERNISQDWVVTTIAAPAMQHPDTDDPALLHALAPIPERDGRVLRVVYNREAEPIRVVTAFFDRTMKGKL